MRDAEGCDALRLGPHVAASRGLCGDSYADEDRDLDADAEPVVVGMSATQTLPITPRTPTTRVIQVSVPWEENLRTHGETASQALSTATTQDRHDCSRGAWRATNALPIRMSAPMTRKLQKMSECAFALEYTKLSTTNHAPNTATSQERHVC